MLGFIATHLGLMISIPKYAIRQILQQFWVQPWHYVMKTKQLNLFILFSIDITEVFSS